MSVVLMIFLGIYFGSIMACYVLWSKKGPEAPNYYGDPDMTRTQIYDDFMAEIERVVSYLRDREKQVWLNSSYLQDEIIESLNRIEAMFSTIKLIGSDSLIKAGKNLVKYITRNTRNLPSFESPEFIALKSKFKAEAEHDINRLEYR